MFELILSAIGLMMMIGLCGFFYAIAHAEDVPQDKDIYDL